MEKINVDPRGWKMQEKSAYLRLAAASWLRTSRAFLNVTCWDLKWNSPTRKHIRSCSFLSAFDFHIFPQKIKIGQFQAENIKQRMGTADPSFSMTINHFPDRQTIF